MLKVSNLTKKYSDSKQSLTVFESLNFHAETGEVICFLGPSGCGKSTLLRCLAGLTPYEGQVILNDHPAEKNPGERNVGFAFQDSTLIGWKSVFDNILLPSQIGKRSTTNFLAKEKAERLIEIIGLNDYTHFYPHQLSGGMRQRVALARALLLSPKVFLLDEPFSFLDSLTRISIMVELKRMLANEKITAVLITHNIEEAAYMSDRVYILGKSPTIITDEVVVSYNHPRDVELLDTEEFTRVVAMCRKKLFRNEK